ncbi:SdpI family protein [Paenarthrobacter sp. NPDC057981]|uniref:SdpI family protein n=1 Tax=Paenarthrobacter sp. NPDC057981 TaxID=3346297 RepID=UPI0036DA0882
MSSDQIGLVTGLGVLGAVLLAGGVLGLGGRPPMNPVVGIRLPSVMMSDVAWRAGHRSAGPYLILGGASAGAAAVVSALRPSANPVTVSLAGGGSAVLFLVIGAVVASKSALRAESRQPTSTPGAP